jgi:hypothetical protein
LRLFLPNVTPTNKVMYKAAAAAVVMIVLVLIVVLEVLFVVDL